MQYIILWVLALFGIWEIVSRLLDCVYWSNHAPDVEIVIRVCNQEAVVENIVREVFKLNSVWSVRVLDMGSTDGTLEVLRRMEREYSKLKVIEVKR